MSTHVETDIGSAWPARAAIHTAHRWRRFRFRVRVRVRIVLDLPEELHRLAQHSGVEQVEGERVRAGDPEDQRNRCTTGVGQLWLRTTTGSSE
jgi:hypothetical protein